MSDFLSNTKHQWPYLSWNDIEILTSPLFWIFTFLLFAGLIYAGGKTRLIVITGVITLGFLALVFGGLIASYTVIVIAIFSLAVVRRSRFLLGSALIMGFIADILLTLSYALCRVDFDRMTTGPGPHKIPDELGEGMQDVFAFLIAYYVFTIVLGFYLYRTRPDSPHSNPH